jgi:transposase
MSNPAPAWVVTDGQRAALEVLSKSQTASHREVQRAQVLLMAAEGLANESIAKVAGTSPGTVRAWRARFEEEGLAKLGTVRAGRGRKPVIPQSKIDEIVDLTRNSKSDGHTHWSVRTMAAKVGVSPAQVQRIWSAGGLKPHRVEAFKLSTDPRFEEKLIDVVGLYLNPPEQAIVLCMDEKSSIQALDRTQPSLPMKKGRGETMTHDYKRNGTTTLFAALDVASGKVIGSCLPKHRHTVPDVPENTREGSPGRTGRAPYSRQLRDTQTCHCEGVAGKTSKVPPALHAHVLVLAEPGRAVFPGTDRQGPAARRIPFRAGSGYLAAHNDEPKPLVWTATAESILEKVARGRVALQALNQN